MNPEQFTSPLTFNHLVFMCAKSNRHAEHVKPSYTTPFDALTFDILIQEMVFQEVDRVLCRLRHLKRMLKGSPLLSFLAVFACLLFHCLLAFFARLHLPRAWHQLVQALIKRKHFTHRFALKIFMAI